MSAIIEREKIRGERERKRIAGNLSNAMLPVLRRALDDAVESGAGVVFGEVVEADAHAEESIESFRGKCNEEIRKADANTDRVRADATKQLGEADERTRAAKKERDDARRERDDEREKRIKAEAARDRLQAQLNLAKRHLDEAKAESS